MRVTAMRLSIFYLSGIYGEIKAAKKSSENRRVHKFYAIFVYLTGIFVYPFCVPKLTQSVRKRTIDCDFFAKACEDAGLKVR